MRHGEQVRPSSLPAPHTHLQGRIFIDRCGQLFAEVLSLLRNGPDWRPPEDRWVTHWHSLNRAHIQLKGPLIV